MSGRLTRIVFAALGAALAAALPNGAKAYDVHDYIRWTPRGQLDYRLLLQRYLPVSSFRFGGAWYGYPYSAYGGLLQPSYVYAPQTYYGFGCHPCAAGAPVPVYGP
jgi:hypothetical protein